MAPDLRGHGETVTVDGVDFSKDRQVEDIVAIHKSIFGEQSTPTFVIGHRFYQLSLYFLLHFLSTFLFMVFLGTGLIDFSRLRFELELLPADYDPKLFYFLLHTNEWACIHVHALYAF